MPKIQSYNVIMPRLYCILLILFGFSQAEAKLFRNSYVQFEIPDRWNCAREQTEFICRSSNPKDSREAIIILTAKEVGAMDSLAQYNAYLKKPKSSANKKGQMVRAVQKQISTRRINNHNWVDGLLLHSEIPAYYTRYLATVKSKIAILVTFSAHQRYYTKYVSDFAKAVASLRVIATDALLQRGGTGIGGQGGQLLGSGISSAFPDDMLDEDECYEDDPDCDFEDASAEGDFGEAEKVFGMGLLLLLVGAYIFLKKGKKS